MTRFLRRRRFLASQTGGVSPLLTSLVSHWSLEEASGTRVDDYGDNDLTDNNTVTMQTGKVGNAAEFTSANSESLSVADNASLAFAGSFTIACWIYQVTRADASIATKWGASSNEFELITQTTNQGRPSFFVSANGSAAVGAAWGSALSATTWYFVEAYYDHANSLVGVNVNNGTPVTAAFTGPIFAGTHTLRIGGRDDGAIYFNGRVDEAAIWDRTLTASERAWLYNAGSGRTWAEILAYRG